MFDLSLAGRPEYNFGSKRGKAFYLSRLFQVVFRKRDNNKKVRAGSLSSLWDIFRGPVLVRFIWSGLEVEIKEFFKKKYYRERPSEKILLEFGMQKYFNCW